MMLAGAESLLSVEDAGVSAHELLLLKDEFLRLLELTGVSLMDEPDGDDLLYVPKHAVFDVRFWCCDDACAKTGNGLLRKLFLCDRYVVGLLKCLVAV